MLMPWRDSIVARSDPWIFLYFYRMSSELLMSLQSLKGLVLLRRGEKSVGKDRLSLVQLAQFSDSFAVGIGPAFVSQSFGALEELELRMTSLQTWSCKKLSSNATLVGSLYLRSGVGWRWMEWV